MGSGVDFERVLQDELDEIRESRRARTGMDAPPGTKLEEDLFGVAFSGGGIRSATFNLGVLQALARKGLLKRIDYLSTVSGGGYIGSWLQAWVSRASGGIHEVEAKLQAHEPGEVAWLRRFSNYLTPRLGLFGADTWTVVAIYLRNLLLTQTALVSGIVVLLAFAWLLFSAIVLTSAGWAWGSLALIGMAVCAGVGFANLGRWDPLGPRSNAQGAIQRNVVVPLLGTAVFASIAVGAFPGMGWMSWAPTMGLVFSGCWTIAAGAARKRGSSGPTLKSATLFARWTAPAAFVAGGLAGALLGTLADASESWSPRALVVAMPPLVTLLFALASTIQIGLVCRRYSDPSFEWWGRLGGWLLIYAAGWFALFGLALYGAKLATWFAGIPGSLPAWVASWASGLLLAKSGKDRPPGESSKAKGILAAIAPYAFVGGLLVLMAAGFERAVRSEHEWIVAAVVAAALAVLWRFSQINRLSMHGLYRNRLVRCYLGASNRPKRRADGFTGFSPEDDLALARVQTRKGPYAIVNTAINLSDTRDLAWQERKAAAFAFTPAQVGYVDGDEEHYRPTKEYGGGYSLGAAMAISGAAASPNMGFRTSAPFAFLMAMFNIRLGWWTGNPADEDTWKRMVPERGGFAYLAKELLGSTGNDSPYVYLSDGGHFENLGLYELVRRRCRFIIVSDAGCDPRFQFEDLGNAVRKCRIDFGVQIDIDVHDIEPEKRKSDRHCAVGSIRYPDGRRGTLLYLKPSLTQDEPADVQNYAAEHADFPHQTTGDQWFAESQFESYRKLGRHIAERALDRAGSTSRTLAAMFTDLRYGWFATARASTATFTRHAGALDSLVEQMRNDPELAFLDESFWPEWQVVVDDLVKKPRARAAAAAKPTTPRVRKLTPEEFRAGFYFCLSLIQLMENVFLDLHLDEPAQRRHPDNRGWMNLFRHFSWAGMFRLTWAIAASTYGARFQNFCRESLDLDVGDELQVHLRRPNRGKAATLSTRWNTMLKNRAEHLNFHERDLLARLLATDFVDWGARPLRLAEFCIAVADPSGRFATTHFGCGFAVLQETDEGPDLLCTMRIPDHLRRMGLARRALVALTQELDAKPVLAPPRDVGIAEEAEPATIQTERDEKSEQRLEREALYQQLERGRTVLGWILDSID